MNGDHLIISQHALKQTLDKVTNKASFRAWEQSRHSEPRETPIIDREHFSAVIEAAANNPIGLAILARRTLYSESYQEAVAKVGLLTHLPTSEGAARVRIHKLKVGFTT